MIRIGVITHNRRAALERLVGAKFFTRAIRDAQVLVLNQASTDGTTGYLDSLSYVTPWHSGQMVSTAAARQRLVDRWMGEGLAPDDALVFLDDDIVPIGARWLKQLVEGLEQADIYGKDGRVITPDWMTAPAGPDPVHYVSGGWCAIRGSVFLNGAEFDHRYQGTYWDDVDLCLQVRAQGGVIAADPSIELDHISASDTAQWSRWLMVNRDIMKAKWHGRITL